MYSLGNDLRRKPAAHADMVAHIRAPLPIKQLVKATVMRGCRWAGSSWDTGDTSGAEVTQGECQ